MITPVPDGHPFPPCSRRSAIKSAGAALAMGTIIPDDLPAQQPNAALTARPWINIRGIYGGYINQILDRGESPADYGVNAIWVGSGSLSSEQIERYHKLGLKVFAEFNSMHV